MRYFRIVFYLIKQSIAITLMYRVNLYGSMLSSLLWLALTLVSISILTYQSIELGGWSKMQLFAVQGVYSIVLGSMYFLFGDNLKRFSRLINRGDLDLMLTKPVDSQFIVSVGEYKVYQLTRVVTGLVLLVYALSVLQIVPTPMTMFLFMVFLVASSIIVYSIWFTISTFVIWLVTLFNIHELFIHLTGLTRYPLEILRFLHKYLLYITLPLVVITSVPSQIILQKFNAQLSIAAIIMAVVFLIVSRKFWQFALRYYTSASS